jgi:lysophospholipase L1-like esterase
MKQFFLLGASSVYGVGGTNGGFGELLKQHMHQKMYTAGGEGEVYEVFNFGKSGATADFVLDTFPEQIKRYGRKGEIVSIVSVGGNDSKAVNSPGNFVSTPEEYEVNMARLLDLLKSHSHQVLVVGGGYVDESKVNPKSNPFGGYESYFTNERRELFKQRLRKICQEKSITLIEPNVDLQTWLDKYTYEDGLHPNNAGYELMFDAVKKTLNL